MKKYLISRDEFNWAEEFYPIFKQKTSLPSSLGDNADALWDMLTGFVETPLEMTLVGFKGKENKYNRMILDLIISVFDDAVKEYPEEFTVIYID